jgi:uncharacterized protein (DUF1015 family)
VPYVRFFRGIFYNPNQVRLGDVIAPPYDVISPAQQNELYERDPFNVVRLILGREENRYTSAKKYFDEWIERGVLIQDDEPCIYVLVQQFVLPNKPLVTRRGFIAACRLENFRQGSIFPHEKTLAKPKEDRFRLFQATGSMFSQVFSLYSDPSSELDERIDTATDTPPYIDVEFESVRNRLWKLSDREIVQPIIGFLKDKRVFVADGHHRYETALIFRDSMRLKHPEDSPDAPYNFIPMFFTNMDDPGLIVLPTHRLIHSLPEFHQTEFIEKLRLYFECFVVDSDDQLLQRLDDEQHLFGLALPVPPRFLFLRLRPDSRLETYGIPKVLADLNVTIVHSLILGNILHISDEDQEKKLYLDYEKDARTAIRSVREGRAQAAILLNPTPIEQLRAVAEAGYTIPQKSTYFYPKLLSGLVAYSFIQS